MIYLGRVVSQTLPKYILSWLRPFNLSMLQLLHVHVLFLEDWVLIGLVLNDQLQYILR